MKKVSQSSEKKIVRALHPILILVLVVMAHSAHADITGEIINISRKLRMTMAEPPSPRDIYINRGELNGVKPGDVLQVFRETVILDALTGSASSLVRIPMGEIKVILTGQYASVARITSLRPVSELPVLDFPWIMMGDQVELKQSLPFQTDSVE